ncbi:MAG TPA: deoxyribonuclease IV [Candidatus Andersenbacteria bacterium]|nr:deoxyribonuclease IV [Candidatus Andersenbacteria bacterium]
MKNTHRIGLHVSAAGGLSNAPENAKAMDAECFQFFSRSPRGGGAAVITDEQADLFKKRSTEYGLESYIHTPYYINFASKNNKIYHGSINAVREELTRGTKLGVKYVVTHLGSAKDHVTDKDSSTVPPEAIAQAIDGLKKIFETEEELTTELLLEISAGAGAVLGDSFGELATLLEGLDRKDVHVCLDTCHMFASGYDIRTEETLEKTMKEFRSKIGTKHLKLVHMNDSKKELGSHRDLHEHIGMGEIGETGFMALLQHDDFQNVNFILETKHDEHIKNDLEFLKKHRS